MIKLSDIDTRHLFFILRMIWNHSMPVEAATHSTYKRYSFNSFYNKIYMIKAISNIIPELFSRDLTVLSDTLLRQLEFMQNYFKKLEKMRIGYE